MGRNRSHNEIIWFLWFKRKLHGAFVDSTKPEEVIEEAKLVTKLLDKVCEKSDLTKVSSMGH